MRITDPDVFARFAVPHAGRHTLSRRQLLKAGAATTAVMAAAGIFVPTRAAAAAPGEGTPVPVPPNPGAFGLHIYFVDPNAEPSAITDFNGKVGAAIVDGTGIGTSVTGTKSYLFDTDMRFMQGIFRATDGRVHQGTFAFV
jgi:TAT (twin-arginine translocation) pathway signal sequence